MKIRFNRVELGFYFLFLGTLIMSFYVRCAIFNENIAVINLLSIVGICVISYYACSGNRIIYVCNEKLVFLFLGILSLLFWGVQLIYSQKDFWGSLRYYTSIIIPTVLLYIRINKKYFDRIFKMFVRFLELLVAIMFIMLVLDLLTNNGVYNFFAKMTEISSMQLYSNSLLRHASIMGHFIPTAEIYLIYYLVHAVEMSYDKRKKKNNVFHMTIALIGTCSTASKAGIALLILSIIIYNIKDIRRMIISVTAVLCLYAGGAFDFVLNRLATTDITTGRIERLIYLNEHYNLWPLIGHGANSSYVFNNVISWASAAFEFPVVMFSYEYGTIFTVIFYLFVFLFLFTKCGKNIHILT